jgi:hypothetical protein
VTEDAAPATSALAIAAAAPRKASWKDGLRGAWLMAIQLLFYDLVFRVSFRLSGSVKDYPGGDPPWYFIRRDAIEGACSLVALAICLVLALLAWKKYPTYAPMLAWFSLLSFGGRVWKFLVISTFTHHLHQADRTTTRWPTFTSYLHDPLFTAGEMGIFVLVFGIVILGSVNLRKARAEGRWP